MFSRSLPREFFVVFSYYIGTNILLLTNNVFFQVKKNRKCLKFQGRKEDEISP